MTQHNFPARTYFPQNELSNSIRQNSIPFFNKWFGISKKARLNITLLGLTGFVFSVCRTILKFIF